MKSVKMLILNQEDIPATFQISEVEFEEGWHNYLDTKYFGINCNIITYTTLGERLI